MTEFVDGHRWPPRAVTPDDAPSVESSPESNPALISDSADGSPDDLPPFEVRADYGTQMVAVLFAPEHVPYLMRHPLFQASSGLLQGALIDCEQWIDEQIKDTRDRQLRQVGR